MRRDVIDKIYIFTILLVSKAYSPTNSENFFPESFYSLKAYILASRKKFADAAKRFFSRRKKPPRQLYPLYLNLKVILYINIKCGSYKNCYYCYFTILKLREPLNLIIRLRDSNAPSQMNLLESIEYDEKYNRPSPSDYVSISVCAYIIVVVARF